MSSHKTTLNVEHNKGQKKALPSVIFRIVHTFLHLNTCISEIFLSLRKAPRLLLIPSVSFAIPEVVSTHKHTHKHTDQYLGQLGGIFKI